MEGKRDISPMREIRKPRKIDSMRRPKSPNLSMREVKIDQALVVQMEDPDLEVPERDLYLNVVLRSDGDDNNDFGAAIESIFGDVVGQIQAVEQAGEVLVGVKIKFGTRDLAAAVIAVALQERLMGALFGEEA